MGEKAGNPLLNMLKLKTYRNILILLLVLNIFDAFSTLYLVSGGFAREINPLMESLLDLGPFIFLFFKLVTTGIGIFAMWLAKDLPLAHILTIGLLVLYIVVLFFHLNIIIVAFL